MTLGDGITIAAYADEAKPQQKTGPPPSAEETVMIPEKKKVGSPLESPALRRQSQGIPPGSNDSPESTVDTNYAYIQFKDR